jgi:hypothetical protein
MDAELVAVLEVHDSFALSLAKAALDEADVPYVVSGEQKPDYYIGCFGSSEIGETPLWSCSCLIMVRRENETAARELLESLSSD